MSIKITKEEIKEYEKLKIISKITLLKEKISLFEIKYGGTIGEFKESMSKKEEDFQEWDDFIEWKATVEALDDLKKKLADIKNAKDIQII